MYVVYILCSEKNPTKHYVGFTRNLKVRLADHNRNLIGYTRKYAPWFVETYVVFSNKERAIDFEKYLKRGSGHAFLMKHFV